MEDKNEPARNSRLSPAQLRVRGAIVLPICLVVSIFLLQGQLQLARVLTTGLPAHGTVIAVDNCSKGWARFTVRFTDAQGTTYTVNHFSYILGCSDNIQAGESTTVRYVPSDPTLLLTQAEINKLPFAYYVFALFDLVFMGGGALIAWLVFLKPLTARLLASTGVAQRDV